MTTLKLKDGYHYTSRVLDALVESIDEEDRPSVSAIYAGVKKQDKIQLSWKFENGGGSKRIFKNRKEACLFLIEWINMELMGWRVNVKRLERATYNGAGSPFDLI